MARTHGRPAGRKPRPPRQLPPHIRARRDSLAAARKRWKNLSPERREEIVRKWQADLDAGLGSPTSLHGIEGFGRANGKRPNLRQLDLFVDR